MPDGDGFHGFQQYSVNFRDLLLRLFDDIKVTLGWGDQEASEK